jgi:hypothetical protein
MTHVRTTLAATVAALASTVGLAGAAPASAPATDGPTTAVTLDVKNCDGCVVELSSVMRTDWQDVWVSPERKVRNGRVTFRVPTERTRGLSIAIDTPWATRLAHQTMVALRYRGYDAGDRVRFADIRDQRRAHLRGRPRHPGRVRLRSRGLSLRGTCRPMRNSGRHG